MPSPAISLRSASKSASVIACVDNSIYARNVACVGASLAEALDLPLTLLHVVEPGGEPAGRPDPIDWGLRRHQARRLLARLSENLPLPAGKVRLEVAEGERVRTICDHAVEPCSILVIGAIGQGELQQRCGRTAQQVLEEGTGPVLLVPNGQSLPRDPFSRILVPLDGSSYAEAALAEAARLAHKTGAELLLTHVVPEAGLALFGPPETVDIELRRQVDRRNELMASNFLERTGRRFADLGIKVRSLCFKGDTRSTLLRAIAQEKPSLVIIASRGQGGKQCHDLSLGGTASYLLAHLAGPMMVVRPAVGRAERPLPGTVLTRHPALAFAG